MYMFILLFVMINRASRFECSVTGDGKASEDTPIKPYITEGTHMNGSGQANDIIEDSPPEMGTTSEQFGTCAVTIMTSCARTHIHLVEDPLSECLRDYLYYVIQAHICPVVKYKTTDGCQRTYLDFYRQRGMKALDKLNVYQAHGCIIRELPKMEAMLKYMIKVDRKSVVSRLSRKLLKLAKSFEYITPNVLSKFLLDFADYDYKIPGYAQYMTYIPDGVFEVAKLHELDENVDKFEDLFEKLQDQAIHKQSWNHPE